jgi:putative hemolysin
MSLSKIRIRHMLSEKIKGADLIHRLVDNPSRLLGVILVGNNIVNIGASALATSLAIDYYGTSGVGISTAIMTILVLIFGEITPKSLAAQNSEKVSLKVSRPIYLISVILNPVTSILIRITNFIIKLLGGKVDIRQPYITEEEIKTLINVGHEEGILERDEKKIIHNVFEFGDLQVRDVMTPRMNMIAIELASTYEEIMNTFKEQRFSRLPVYKDRTDNIVGILHLKDLFFFDGNNPVSFDINKYMRSPFFTFEFKQITELFAEMRSNRIPLSIVLDEYGGTAGIITMEDLIEEIVGDIQDEYDEQDNDIEVVKEDEYIVDGTMRIEMLNELIGISIESEDFDSIGGFVVGLFGRLPEEEQIIEYENLKFKVEKIEKNRISSLRIFT